jgi:thiol-disulfide isomerase/thioredoxin
MHVQSLLVRRPFFTVAATLVLGAVFTAPLWCRGDDAGTQTPALVGKPAPNFTLETADGKKVTLSELKGNVVLVDFWATWCVPCRVSLPHIQHLSEDKDLSEKGLKVLAVNFEDEKDKIAAFLEKNKLASLSVPMDSEGKADESFQVTAYPSTFVVGRDGTIRNGWVGFDPAKTPKEIDDAVAAALKEPAPKK